MSDQNAETTETAPQLEKSKLDLLKEEAKSLGINFHPNSKEKSLQIKIDQQKLRLQEMQKNTPVQDPALNQESPPQAVTRHKGPAKPARTLAQIKREQMMDQRKDAEQLIRIQLTCMNPNKKDWEGEIFSAGNSKVGQHKKFIPFNTPWHVPKIIVNMLKERKCQIFKTVTDRRGNKTRKGELIDEFNVVELPALKEKELQDLAKQQAMAGTIDSE